MTLGQGIRAAIDARGLKDTWVADGAGITKQTLSNIITGQTKDPSIAVVAAIADVLEESIDALLGRPVRSLMQHEQATLVTAAGIITNRLVAQPNEQRVATTPIVRRNRRRTPRSVVAPEVAASPSRQIFTDVRELPKKEIPNELRNQGVRRVYRVQGESMTGAGIQHGDVLYVKTDVSRAEANGKIVVCRVGDFECVKRLDIRADGRVRLLSENPDPAFHPVDLTEVEANELVVIGVVAAHLTRL